MKTPAPMEKLVALPTGSGRMLTRRSVFFSLLGILCIAGLSGFHDERMFGSTLAIGNHLPVAAFGYLFFLGLVWNGVMSRLRRRWALDSRELALVMIVCLVTCFAPTSGLFRYFHRGIMMPWQVLASGARPEWVKYGLLEKLLPPELFPDPVPVRDANGVLIMDQTVYRGFFTGLKTGTSYIGLGGLPFRAWIGPLLHWGPLVLLAAFASTALAFLVHRQWSRYEQLSYPVAQLAQGLCHRSDGARGVPDVYRSRLFWFGFCPLLLLYLLEYLSLWFPEAIPGMRTVLPALKHWELPVTAKFPLLTETPASRALNRQTLYFCVVGLAYFTSSEVSLTMGLSAMLLAVCGLWYRLTTGIPMMAEDVSFIRSGAAIGYAVVLLFMGRRYYGAVLLRACGLGRSKGKVQAAGQSVTADELKAAGGEGGVQQAQTSEASQADDDDAGVLAARILLLATAGFVLLLSWFGASWPMALFFALLLQLMFLVLARIVCETGIPFVQAGWMPTKLMVSLTGPAFIGPRSLALLHWSSIALSADPRECLLPYAATATRLAEEARLRQRKVLWLALAVILGAVAVAFVAEHWTLYNLGPTADAAAATNVPGWRFDELAGWMSSMENLGILTDSFEARGLARLALFAPEPRVWGWLSSGIGLVLLLSLLRVRFARFPIHPVLLLVWGTYPAINVWGSFLLGWFLKSLVVKFGGGTTYHRLKPVFIGLVASELIASAGIVVFDLLYCWTTGDPPPVLYRILPG